MSEKRKKIVIVHEGDNYQIKVTENEITKVLELNHREFCELYFLAEDTLYGESQRKINTYYGGTNPGD